MIYFAHALDANACAVSYTGNCLLCLIASYALGPWLTTRHLTSFASVDQYLPNMPSELILKCVVGACSQTPLVCVYLHTHYGHTSDPVPPVFDISVPYGFDCGDVLFFDTFSGGCVRKAPNVMTGAKGTSSH